MCTILRKDIWSYWTVLMAWLKLITWRHWQFHQALLNHITWLYWTVSPGVTGPYHLTLLDSFTLRYWNLSHDVTQSTGQQSSCSVCNNQLFKLRLFLEMIAINMTNFSMTSADRYLANNWQIKRALPALVSVMLNYCIIVCIIHHS